MKLKIDSSRIIFWKTKSDLLISSDGIRVKKFLDPTTEAEEDEDDEEEEEEAVDPPQERKVLTGDEIPKISFGNPDAPEKINFGGNQDAEGGENADAPAGEDGQVPPTGKKETPPSPLPSINSDELVDIELPNGMKIKTKVNEANKRRLKKGVKFQRWIILSESARNYDHLIIS